MDVDEILARHQPERDRLPNRYCDGCGGYWPCDAYEAATSYRTLQEAAIMLLAEKKHVLDFRGGYKKVEEFRQPALDELNRKIAEIG